jgi:hypothetical protein
LEREFAFGVVRQLMEPLLADPAERAHLLSGAAAAAAPVFDLTAGETGGDTSFSILHGLYWLVLRAAERAPLLLSVDDIQWCDSGTVRFLAYLVRRVPDLPVLVVATRRTGEGQSEDVALIDLAHATDTVLIEPRPLSDAGVAALVRQRLGEPEQTFVAACSRTTGGNPLLLRQLLRALESDQVIPDAAHADTVNAIGSRAVSSVVLRRVASLGPDVSEVARAVAVLGDGCHWWRRCPVWSRTGQRKRWPEPRRRRSCVMRIRSGSFTRSSGTPCTTGFPRSEGVWPTSRRPPCWSSGTPTPSWLPRTCCSPRPGRMAGWWTRWSGRPRSPGTVALPEARPAT